MQSAATWPRSSSPAAESTQAAWIWCGRRPGHAVHARYPRLRMVTALVDEIVRHAGRSPQNAPRYSIAGELARERGLDGRPTTIEQATLTSRWGE